MFHVVVLFPSFRIWKWLFNYKLQENKDSIPNLISRRQFNDRRKKTAGLREELRKRIAMEMDGGEEQFFVDSKPIEVCGLEALEDVGARDEHFHFHVLLDVADKEGGRLFFVVGLCHHAVFLFAVGIYHITLEALVLL